MRYKKLLNRYNLIGEELDRIIEIYLTDEEKAKLFEFEHFKNLYPYRIKNIIKLIKDDELKLKLLKDDALMSGMSEFDIVDIVKLLEDDNKMQVLKDENYRKKYNIEEYDAINIIMTFTNESKNKLLLHKDFLERELKIRKYGIGKIIASLEGENEKLKFIKYYELKNNEIEYILTYMEVSSIINFLNVNKQFCREKGINPYVIMAGIDSKKQLEFISKLDDLEELSIRRKKKDICSNRKRN